MQSINILALIKLYYLQKYMPNLASLFSHVLVDVSSVKALCLRWYPKGNSLTLCFIVVLHSRKAKFVVLLSCSHGLVIGYCYLFECNMRLFNFVVHIWCQCFSRKQESSFKGKQAQSNG